MKAGCRGGSDPPGPVSPVPGLPPQGSPPSLPGPLCLLGQGSPFQGHPLPGHPAADTAMSASHVPWPSPLPTLPPGKVLTLASASSDRMVPDWELSLWDIVSVVGEKTQEKHHGPPSQLNILHSSPAPTGRDQAGRDRRKPGWDKGRF